MPVDIILLKKGVAALLLAGTVLCALSACGAEEAAPTTVPTTSPETTVTEPEASQTIQTVPTTAPTTAPSISTESTQCTHQFSQWVTVSPATCTTDGAQSRQCTLCGEEQQEVLYAVGHSWDGGRTGNTGGVCGGGETVYSCGNCGATHSQPLPANHSFGQWEYEAYTYTIYYEPDSIEYVHGGPSSTHESHRKIRTCEKCGFVEKDNTPDHSCKRGSVHHTVTTIREVTCSERGIKRTTCNICGWYEDYEYGDLERGHAWESETRHLTDYSETTNYLDVEILTCSACGEKEYYYRTGDSPCVCGRTPCVAADSWVDCDSYCAQSLMYGDYRISIDSRAYLWGHDGPFGDRYYVNTSDSSARYNPDGFILHPTWQTVWRDYVFNEEGELIQFTVLWHDMEGNLFSGVVFVPDLPRLFAERGIDAETLARPEICFHLTPNKGHLIPTSVSYTG